MSIPKELSDCCQYAISDSYSDGSKRKKEVCEKCWKECERMDIYALILLLEQMYESGKDPFYPDAMWNVGMTTPQMEEENTEEPMRYIGLGLGRRSITPMFRKNTISEEDAKFICLLRNALPKVLSYIE